MTLGRSPPILQVKRRSWREGKWLDRGNTDRTEPRGSPALRTFRNRKRSDGAGTSSAGRVRCATTMHTVTGGCTECSTIWETPDRKDRSIFSSGSRNIIVLAARSTSTPTCLTWHCPGAATPTVSFRRLSGWSSKMVSPTEQHPGTSGEITASSCPSPQFRTGSRRREKKGEERIEGDYLAWALRDFSGYIAADELYDGPFGMCQ